MKKCSKCHVDKHESEFGKHKKTKDGLYCQCKPCCSESQKTQRRINYSDRREWEKNNYQKNKNNILKSCKKYRENNKERLKLYYKNYNTTHKEQRNRNSKKYAINNPEKVKKSKIKCNRRYKETLPDSVIRCNTNLKHFPKEFIDQYPILIELKRVEIKTKRQIKNQIK